MGRGYLEDEVVGFVGRTKVAADDRLRLTKATARPPRVAGRASPLLACAGVACHRLLPRPDLHAVGRLLVEEGACTWVTPVAPWCPHRAPAACCLLATEDELKEGHLATLPCTTHRSRADNTRSSLGAAGSGTYAIGSGRSN